MRILLLPFSFIYAIVLAIRNMLYDFALIKSTVFGFPVIGVGNLRVGGTGKTPMIEYLVSYFQKDYHVGALSRGYGRNTVGYLEVNIDHDAEQVGDEPLQVKSKFPEVLFAVDENRVDGINKMMEFHPETNVILLDDVFQHRNVKPGLQLLLTSYHELYSSDYLLPAGMLRDSRSSSRRADVILVTKCPENLDVNERNDIKNTLNPLTHQRLFFAFEQYGELQNPKDGKLGPILNINQEVILITGIADSSQLVAYLTKTAALVHHLEKRDHQNFITADLHWLLEKSAAHPNAIFVTTSKDAQRLKKLLSGDKFNELRLFILPMEMKLFKSDEQAFNTILDDFVRAYR